MIEGNGTEFVSWLWQGCNFLKAGVVTFGRVSLWNADSGLFADKSIM